MTADRATKNEAPIKEGFLVKNFDFFGIPEFEIKKK